jgi:hypothetical protein
MSMVDSMAKNDTRLLELLVDSLEKCMKFLNKNAYIQTAIYGYSFCKSARSAFFLIARNILRIIAVSCVGDFVLFLGKVTTSPDLFCCGAIMT